MTFSEFAKMLYPFCGKGNKTSDFVISLFANIMEDPPNNDDVQKDLNDEYNPFAKLHINTLEKIYGGSREISEKRASIVLNHLDKEKFNEYINNLPLDTISLLSNALHDYGIDVEDLEVPGKCSDIFASIIKDRSNPGFIVSISTGLVPASLNYSNTIPGSDLYLLMEASSMCPLCGKPLIGDKNNNSLNGYNITYIVPSALAEEQETELEDLVDSSANSEALYNKIALCLTCANRYTSHTARDEYMQLMDIKDRLHRNFAAFETLDKLYLEEQIETVLRQISTASLEQLSDKLNYNALRVREKISGSNVPLLIKIEGYVVPYYNFIKSVFSQLEREGTLYFKDVAYDVRRSYRKLQSSGLSQDEIYTQLVNWFKNKTNAQSILACEIIVAFFVQNCEVFHALTE